MNGVDADAFWSELEGRGLGHATDGELAGDVGHDARARHHSVHRRDVDDRAAGTHRCAGRLHAQPAANLIDVDDRHVLVERHVGHHADTNDPRIVDEYIETTKGVAGGLHRLLPIVLVRDIEVHVAGTITERCRDGVTLRVEYIAEDDRGAFGEKQSLFGFPLPL